MPAPNQTVCVLLPDEVRSYLENWENLWHAFHWKHHPVPPLLLVNRNHQQDAVLLRWEGLVAGTDWIVDERTECMGAG